ncbi:cell wall teichoic acid glycosylation protein GtcA [Clostridium sp. CAG:798]|jgi:putative cell wall teichoic acid glycosylation protein gtcA|nr:cell wall teichoic acid glycosylation protein GtcA [Clostridium sp. CAG:798]
MNIIKSLIKKFCTKEFIFYLIFGVLTTIVSLSVYYFCVLTFLNPNNAFQLQIANILSWILAVAFAYATNRKFVFESKDPNKLKELIKFVTARLLTLFLDMLVMFILVTLLHFNDKISKLISQVIITISNYIFSKIFVFKK